MGNGAMGRNRLTINRKCEKYVKALRKNGAFYYSYKHPRMAKPKTFGQDLERANACALAVNAHYANVEDDVSNILNPAAAAPPQSLAEVIDRFIKEKIPAMGWSANYQREVETRLQKIRKKEGHRAFAKMGIPETRDVIFNNFAGDGRRHAKIALTRVYKFAIGAGLSNRQLTNYAEMIDLPPKAKRQRKRIDSYDDYLEAREKCEPWLQLAADFALVTLQARLEIVTARTKDIVREKNKRFIAFGRQKTGYSVKIEVTDSLQPILQQMIEASMQTGCPFLVNTQFRGKVPDSKEHRCQVLPDYLTRAWTEATGYAFHEIRSLGSRLYEQQLTEQGMTREEVKSYIKSLTGWKEDGMFELYVSTDEVKYFKAVAGLRLVENK